MDSAKNIIRDRMKKSREDYFKSLSESGKSQLNKELIKNILTLIPANMNGPIAVFWPMTYEPDIRPIFDKILSMGRKVLLPVIQGPRTSLIFRNWKTGDRLQESNTKTMEPLLKSTIYEPEVLLIPLLGFDNRGHRLGYGAGHYDRTLMQFYKKKLNILTIGVAYEMQHVNELPIGSYDQPLHWVATEEKIYKFV
ncbi:MAG: 5-formyltetrahydrofolate cyclo-ligase [Janthinobacterium lividum]